MDPSADNLILALAILLGVAFVWSTARQAYRDKQQAKERQKTPTK